MREQRLEVLGDQQRACRVDGEAGRQRVGLDVGESLFRRDAGCTVVQQARAVDDEVQARNFRRHCRCGRPDTGLARHVECHEAQSGIPRCQVNKR